MSETVLTSRRATVPAGRGRIRGRLRLSDRALRFEPRERGRVLEVVLADVTSVRSHRGAVLVRTASGSLRLRCFGARGVAALVERAWRSTP